MKATRNTFCLIIAMILIFSTFSAGALSFAEPYQGGDVNMSHDITVSDATLIQKYIANIQSLSKGQVYLADTDSDGFVTVKDATAVQKYVARLNDKFAESRYFYDYVLPYTFNASFDSGVAPVGEEVTFYANGSTFNNTTMSYEFAINGETLQPRSSEDEFTYTFATPGTFEVSVTMYDEFDNSRQFSTNYEVTAATPDEDSLFIKSFYHDHNIFDGIYVLDTTYTANADGGSGEYEYCFLLNGEVIQDYSAANTCPSPENIDFGEHTFTVYVRDINSGETVSKDLPVEMFVFF